MRYLPILAQDLATRIKRLLRNRNTMAWIIIIPIILMCVIGTILPNDESITSIYVQDKDGSLFSILVVNSLVGEYNAKVIPSDADTATYIDSVIDENPKQTSIFIIIPAGFSHYVTDYLLGNPFSVQLSEGGLSFILDIVKAAGENFDDGNIHVKIHNSHSTTLIAESFKILNSNSNMVKQVYPGISVSLVLLIVSGIVVGTINTEKKSRMDVIHRNTRYNKCIQALSMTIWALIPSAIVFVLSYVTICFFQQIDLSWSVILGLVLASTFGASFGLFMSELIKGTESLAIANASLLFIMLLLSGGIFPQEMLSVKMTEIRKYVPVTYLIDVFRGSMGFEGELLKNCLISLLFIVLMLVGWYALTRYREFKE